MQSLNEILQGVLAQHRLQQGVYDHQLLLDWEQVVGARLARWTRPLGVENGTLVVHVENSTLLHHLSYLTPRLIAHLRRTRPEISIQRVRYTLLEREG